MRPEESGSMNRGAPCTVLYTFHVSLLVRQVRPIRYHHLADLVPRSHLGITVVVLAAIHIVDRRSPLYLLDKPLRVKHVPRFSPFPRSLARFPFYLSPPESISHLLRRDDCYLKIFSRSKSKISTRCSETGDGGTIFHSKMRERKVSLEKVELEESRKRSIGDQQSIRRVKQLFRHTDNSPIDRSTQR